MQRPFIFIFSQIFYELISFETDKTPNQTKINLTKLKNKILFMTKVI